MTKLAKVASKCCEDVLEEMRLYNIEHNICSSENKIIDCMSRRIIELHESYEEISTLLNNDKQQIWIFFDTILGAAVCWNPKKSKNARQDGKELAEINQNISRASKDLASLISKRSIVENRGNFIGETHYSAMELLIASASGNHHFNSQVKEELEKLSGRLDLKYWPTIEDILNELSRDATEPGISVRDPIVAAATESNRPSKSDFIRASLEALKMNSSHFPRDFRPSDKTLSALTNVVLDLPADELFSSDNIKNIRHRRRQKPD